jgi:ankyrin repeat protein
MWHTDVARFLLEHGADINYPDHLGRTPLHVAAAVDYPEMCDLLIEKGGNYKILLLFNTDCFTSHKKNGFLSLYNETCLRRTSLGPGLVFGKDRCLVNAG